MPRYRVQIEVDSPEELRRILFSEEKGRAVGASYGYYIAQAKSAVTAACRQIVGIEREGIVIRPGGIDMAKNIIRGTMEFLVQARQRATLIAEDEEIAQAIRILKELADRLKGADQTEALEYCCNWMGKTECP